MLSINFLIALSTLITPIITLNDPGDSDNNAFLESQWPESVETMEDEIMEDSSQETGSQRQKWIRLSLSSNPQFSINIVTNSTSYLVLIFDHYNEEVKMNLIIEELSCSSANSAENKLYIKGEKLSVKLLQDVNNFKNRFQSVSEAYDNQTELEIIPEGNWGNDTITARVVVSVYIERNSCEDCPENFFCCGAKSKSCTSTLLTDINAIFHANEKVRCIPSQFGSSNETLLCNGHPNCGFRCNPDERKNVCENDTTIFGEDKAPPITSDFVWLVILFFIATLLVISSVVICVCFMSYIHQNGGCYNLLFKYNEGSGNASKGHIKPVYTKEPKESFRYSNEYI